MFICGITYEEFGKLTLKRMQIIANAYSEKLHNQLEHEDLVAFIQGQYVMSAIACTVGAMFGGKANYPDTPILQEYSKKILTEEEIQNQRDAFVANYMAMMHNFKSTHKQEEG